MARFEQHFCGVTRYRGRLATSLFRTPNCGVTLDETTFRIVNDSTEQELLSVPVEQVGFSVPKVQGKLGCVAVHVDTKKLLIDFGMVQRAETGRSSGGIANGQRIGGLFLDALRSSGAQPV